MGHKIPDRTFGVELEVAGLSQEQAFLVLRMAGLPVEDPCRHEAGHIRMQKWRFHDDGSIRDTRNDVHRTVEVVSPILSGAKGLKEVRKACAALAKAGAYVNKSCGLHVHVGARDLTVPEVITLCKRYVAHESYIDSILHPSRRGGENRYCNSVQRTLNDIEWSRYVTRLNREIQSHQRWLEKFGPMIEAASKVATEVTVSDVQAHFSGTGTPSVAYPRRLACHNCQRGRGPAVRLPDGYYTGTSRCAECRYNVENFRNEASYYKDMITQIQAKIARGTWDSVEEMASQVADRYRAVNLHAFCRHGTIEFRQHHGALNGDKVSAWITFVLEFVERSRKIAKANEKRPKFKDASPLVGLPKRIKTHFEARRRLSAGARYETWA